MPILASQPEFVRPDLPEDRLAQADSWQQELRAAVRTAGELAALLDLPREIALGAEPAAADFPLLVPRGYLAKIEAGNLHDPLLRQVLPVAAEREQKPGFTVDAVGDAAASLTPGLLQKYPGRALLVTTSACPVHCRYCFRRHYPYAESSAGPSRWSDALTAIAADPTLHEIILSGGDPLMLADETIGLLIQRVAMIPHVRRLRVHTRMPILVPQRVTAEFIELFQGIRPATFVVVHANHPRELCPSVMAALGRMVDAGIPVLNQAVLLRGVNDDADTLTRLCERLIDHRVVPYYLHQLDRVQGSAHFEVPVEHGRQLIAQLRRQLPGYAVPQFVQEIAGQASKQPL